MERLGKEIQTAFSYVSQLCDQFIRKYPQYYLPQMQFDSHPSYNYGIFPSQGNQIQSGPVDPWLSRYQHPRQVKKQTFKIQNRSQKQRDQNHLKHTHHKLQSKKSVKQDKKYEKKIEFLRKQKQLEERERRLAQQQALRNRKKEKNTLKNQIKKDPRYAEKPKFPLSPYFLFLQNMRQNPPTDIEKGILNKKFAQQMGRKWRGMLQEQKKQYITPYLKQKKMYDEKLSKFYQKYPDLKPKGHSKDQKAMYSLDDPKYKDIFNNEQELENDLIDELNSEQDNCLSRKTTQQKQSKDLKSKPLSNSVGQRGQDQQQEEENFSSQMYQAPEWSKQKQSENQERLTSQHNALNGGVDHSFVEIDD